MDTDDLGSVGGRLTAWLTAELPPGADVRIDGLRRTSSGFSRENWVFDAVWQADGREVAEPLIVRRDPRGSVLDTDRGVEFEILRRLGPTAVPAPGVRWLDADGTWLGRPSIVMRREEGDCDWFVLNGPRPAETRLDLAHQFCDLLASIHQLDWRAAGLDAVLADPGLEGAAAAVDHWEAELRRHQLEPLPEAEVVLAWLRSNAPRAQVTTLVHGDFKPGNTLLRGDRVAVMLDWETAHLGDPVEDLGWVTNPLRHREHQIPGAWGRAELLARWEERTGWRAPDDEVRWWNVLANFKLSVIVLTGVAAFVEGRYDRAHQLPVGLYRLMFDMIEA